MNVVARYAWSIVVAAGLAALAGCGSKDSAGGQGASSGGGSAVAVDINMDGSSTVNPLIAALAEEYKLGKNDKANITIAQSGTGGGFKKFINKEIDIALASRPISTEEVEKAKEAGVEFIELPVAFDGLTVVVNPRNDWAQYLTVAELKAIWSPDSKIKNWKDVRAGFPDKPLILYGAGTDSGTFDYFTKAIVGKEKSSRADYTASEDDNMLVTGVAGDEGGLGYFGFSYYIENKDKVRALGIDGGNGPVEPTFETVADATYQPLSRPLFIYVSKASLEAKPGIADFLKYALGGAADVVKETGFIPLPANALDVVTKHLDEKRTGTLFQGAEVGLTIEEVLKRESAAQ